MPESVFNELRRYVGFGADDEAALRALHPAAAVHYQRIAEAFYDRILEHPAARTVLERGESSVGRLKGTLVDWMQMLLSGPWDDAYFEKRCRIGRVHVRVGLPQHYMFGAMNVVRTQLNQVVDDSFVGDAQLRGAVALALSKVLDLELAIMLHTYREDMQAQQARNERLATFGQLVGSIGHELRNPLAVIETSLFILSGRMGTDDKVQKHLRRIGEQVTLSSRIIGNLMDLIRDRPMVAQPVGLVAVLAESLDAVDRPAGVAVRAQGWDTLAPVAGDPAQLRQVIVNLLKNAVDAVGPSGNILLSAAAAPSGGVEFSVEDSGPGLDPAVRHRLFEPLITTKDHGVGLGLALVRRIVERHGGSIHYEPSDACGGARFVVRLP